MSNTFFSWFLISTLLVGLGTLSHNSHAQTFDIQGVSSGEIRDNVQLYLKDVKKPVSEFDVDDYREKLHQQTQVALRAFAYYDASVIIAPFTYQAITTQELNASIQIDIELRPKAQVMRVQLQLDIENADAIPPKLSEVIANIRAMQGKAIDHSRYESLKNQLNTFALLYGYFEFKFLLHKLLIVSSDLEAGQTANAVSDSQSQQNHMPQQKVSSGIVHWIVNLGPRYKFGELSFLEETRGQSLVTRVKPFKKGEYFDQGKVGQLSADMIATGYFNNAIARPNSSEAIDKHVPIEVIITPKPKDLYKFGIGASTDTGPRISIDWERPWVNLDGHSMGAELYVSKPRKSLSFDYRVPTDNPLKDFYSFQAGVQQIQENQTDSDTLSLAVQRQWGAVDELDWDKIAFIKAEQETFTQGLQNEEKTLLVLPGFTFNRTRKRGDIFVSWGDRQQITVEGASTSLLSDIDLFKVTARTKWIREYDSHRFVLRADAGMISTNDFERVPSSQRFFAGGDQSIRGFGLNEVSDVREVQGEEGTELELIGGKYLSVASVEYAYKVAESWRVAVFADVGSASDKFASNLARGVGVGVHWLSPIGSVQIYIAHGKSDIEEGYRVHFVLGEGF